GTDPGDCFERGLKDMGWTVQAGPKRVTIRKSGADSDYGPGNGGHTKLKSLIRGHGGVDLIVAAGGGVSAQAADEELGNKPFVYLAGALPAGGTSVGKGGVILD